MNATCAQETTYTQGTLSDLGDFCFGHAHDATIGTGCTVICAPSGAVGGVAVRGLAPATRETDLLHPENLVESVHAVVLSGGSAFGLEASCGVMDELESRGIGFTFADICVPIVCGASLFDLGVGTTGYPDKAMGRQAAEAAFSGAAFTEGNAGAGMGASVGKAFGMEYAMKSGFGYSVLTCDEVAVGAFVAVNALGSIRDDHGRWIAGCRNRDGSVRDGVEAFLEMQKATRAMQTPESDSASQRPRSNTTIGVIVTNATLSKAEAGNVAGAAHDAYGRAIRPTHTSQDGDAIFALASGAVTCTADEIATMATDAMEQAIYRAVLTAKSAYGLPAASDTNANSTDSTDINASDTNASSTDSTE